MLQIINDRAVEKQKELCFRTQKHVDPFDLFVFLEEGSAHLAD